MPSPLKHAPVSAVDIPAEWIDMVRVILQRNGQPVRGNRTHPFIEVKSMTTNAWQPLGLPAGGTMFLNAAERDLVLGRLI